jgi:hypothetical protein
MSFASFGTSSLEEFVQSESAPDCLWIFLHIPKTAGSSFATELSKKRRPYRNIHVDYSDAATPHRLKMQMAVGQFLSDFQTTAFRSCSGHMNMPDVLSIKNAVPSARTITFLRNPVTRVISDFRYARTVAHPPYREFIAEFPTIESYVESPNSQNKMCKFLSPQRDMNIPELIDYLDSTMSFIGLVEMYPMCFNIFFRLVGLNEFPKIRSNKTNATADNLVVESPALMARIRETNAGDFALYKFVRARLVNRRDEWVALRNTQRPASINRK